MRLKKMKKAEEYNFLIKDIKRLGESSVETLLSKKELVAVFGLSISYISKLMAEDGLPHFKIGRAVRFRVSDVSTWLEKRRIC